MQTATLTWLDPASKVTEIEIAVQAPGESDFTVADLIPAGEQRAVIPDLADGDYVFRAVAVNGKLRSGGVTVSATVSSETQPDDVTDLTVSLS